MSGDQNETSYQAAASSASPAKGLAKPEMQEIPVEMIRIGEFCDRSADGDDINELVASIDRVGLLQPLSVRVNDAGEYELVDGRRRLLAVQQLHRPTVRCQLLDVSAEQGACMSWTANAQRRSLNPLDEARFIKRMHERFNMNEPQIATALNLPQSTVHERWSILSLPENIRKTIGASITYTSAVSLARLLEGCGLAGESMVHKLFRKIQSGKVLTTELRAIVKRITDPKRITDKKLPTDDDIAPLPPMLEDQLLTNPAMTTSMLVFHEHPESLIEGEGRAADRKRDVAKKIPLADREVFIEHCVARGRSFEQAKKLWLKQLERMANESGNVCPSPAGDLLKTMAALMDDVEKLNSRQNALRDLNAKQLGVVKAQASIVQSGIAKFMEQVETDAGLTETQTTLQFSKEQEMTHDPVGTN